VKGVRETIQKLCSEGGGEGWGGNKQEINRN